MSKNFFILSERCIFLIFCILLSNSFSQPNIVVNGDLERAEPFYWHPLNAGDGNSVLNWSDNESYQELRSLKIIKPNVSSDIVGWISENNAQRYWHQMTDDITYELGGYIKTSGVNTNPSNNDEVIGLLFKFFDAGNTLIAEILLPANQTGASVDWHQVSNSVVMPPGSVPDSMICIAQFGKDATGTAWFDLITVQSDPWTAQMFGGEIETPMGWMYWTSPGSDELAMYDDSEAHSGTFSAKLRENDDEADEIVFYSIPVPVEEEHHYHISSWIKTDGVNTDPQLTPTAVTTNRIDNRIGICFFFHVPPIKTSWNLVPPIDLFFYIDQTVYSHDWRKYEAIWKAPTGAAGISMRARFTSFPTGTAWFDDFSIREVVNDSIIVIYPNGGENLYPENDYDIAWTSTESITDVKIEYSTDNGANWSIIENTTPNDGSHIWNVPNTPSTNCLIKISDTDDDPSDMSKATFTIISEELEHFTDVVAPTGRTQPVYIVDALLYGEQLQSGDEVGVFDGDLLVGAAKIQELPMADPITVYLEYTPPGGDPLPGAQDGNDMLFRVWDRSVDLEASANISEVVSGDPVFTESAIVAVRLEAWSTQMIGIRPAFLNLISFNLVPVDPSAVAVFESIFTWLVIVQDHEGLVYIPPDIVFPGHPGSNTIDANGGIKVEKGYNVYISGDSEQTLGVTGSMVDLSETPITVLPQFLNKISFPSRQILLIQNVFNETVNQHIYNDLGIVQDHDGYVYIPPNIVFPGHPGSNTIDVEGGMQPGKGYMLFHNNSGELSFTYLEAAGAAVLAKTKGRVEKDLPLHYTCTKTGESHALFLKNMNVQFEEGDEFGVFASGKCVGSKRYVVDLNDPLILWRALPDYGLKGIKDGDKLEIRLWRSKKETVEILELDGDVVFSKDRVFSLVKISSGMNIDGLNLVSDMIPTEMGLRQNYPNPFNPTTTIEISLNKDSDVSLMIYNIRGEVVRRLVSGYYSAGVYRVEWDSRNENGWQIASGIYFYRIQAGSYIKTRKMIFSK